MHLSTTLRLGFITNTYILFHAALGKLHLKRREPRVRRRREVGEDEDSANGSKDRERALDVEEPTPGGAPELAVHAVEDARREQRVRRAGVSDLRRR